MLEPGSAATPELAVRGKGPADAATLKPTPLKVTAAAISAHLARFAADPAHSHRRWADSQGRERTATRFWGTNAHAAGARVSVTYVSYQGRSTLTRAEAEAYRAWLDAGNVGTHYDSVRPAPPPESHPPRRTQSGDAS
jgi:hypothetical protein